MGILLILTINLDNSLPDSQFLIKENNALNRLDKNVEGGDLIWFNWEDTHSKLLVTEVSATERVLC